MSSGGGGFQVVSQKPFVLVSSHGKIDEFLLSTSYLSEALKDMRKERIPKLIPVYNDNTQRPTQGRH